MASTVAFCSMAVFRYYDIRRRGVGIRIKAGNILILLSAYIVVVGVYYFERDNFTIHIIATILAAIFAICINRYAIGQAKTMMMRRFGKARS